jgi:urease accessory protein
MTSESLSLLQFSDGLFPAGAYAHSHGLETYVQKGTVRDAAGAAEFLFAYLCGSAGTSDAPAVVNTMRAARARDLRRCVKIDAILDAMKSSAELRDASRQLGRQTLRVAAALVADPPIAEFTRMAEADTTPCHHAVVFGLVGAAQRWQPEDGARAYLYSSAAAIAGAALRLISLGQVQAQRLIYKALPLIASLAARAVETDISEMASFAPGLEIAAMRHAKLEEGRLFRS